MASVEGNEEAEISPKNRIKFLCSHGGKILPRPPDGQLKYIGGETRVIAVSRDINFSELMKKFSSLSEGDLVFKYQVLPEDLDTLISVKCDEDLQNMLAEYDRQDRKSSNSDGNGSPLLRAFLFPSNANNVDNQFNPEIMDPHALEQRYIDAINGVLNTPTNFRRRNVYSAGSSPKSLNYDGYTFDYQDVHQQNGYKLRSKDIPRVNSSPSLYNLGHHNHYYHPAHQYAHYPQSGPHGQYNGWKGQQVAPALSVGQNDFARYQIGQQHRPPRYYSPTAPRRGSGEFTSNAHADECKAYKSGGVEIVVNFPHGSVGH
ncbi:hypothetical protein IFM89_009912 [Coptis chinensis]|uniref:PB1 domain-containing protein n=1 Tax=Coptis chinensis TaxID=261450 RepID=A0A835M2Q0_9MAGN|nr:hypothetical protein IFM89_009912 [Coptis chinensis]